MGKSTAAKKPSKAATISPPPLHPPYFEMISEAILTLKERTGSSQPAIAKVMDDKYSAALPPNFKKVLSVQLKKFVKSERLVRVKNSYKLSSTEKLKLSIKETQDAAAKEVKAVKKNPTEEEGRKMKRLSQVKTPEILKKEVKMKRLSQVKTPEGFNKKKKKNSATTPLKRKNLKAESSAKPQKKKKSRK